MEFRQLTGNTAVSTVAGKRIARCNFNMFLAISGLDVLQDLPENTLCDPTLHNCMIWNIFFCMFRMSVLSIERLDEEQIRGTTGDDPDSG